jgi:hypothetical protein
MMQCEGLSQKYASLETPRRVVMCTLGQRVHEGPAGADVTLAWLELQKTLRWHQLQQSSSRTRLSQASAERLAKYVLAATFTAT